MPARRFWTPRRDAHLARLVARKLLTPDIARRLSRPGVRVTINAISSRIHDLGLRLPRGRPKKNKETSRGYSHGKAQRTSGGT